MITTDFKGRKYRVIEENRAHRLLECLTTGDRVRVSKTGGSIGI